MNVKIYIFPRTAVSRKPNNTPLYFGLFSNNKIFKVNNQVFI